MESNQYVHRYPRSFSFGRELVERTNHRAMPALFMPLPIRLLQGERKRSGPVIAQDASADTRDRHDAARRGGGKNLVGVFDEYPRYSCNPGFDPERRAQFEHGFARDAMQTPAIGR